MFRVYSESLYVNIHTLLDNRNIPNLVITRSQEETVDYAPNHQRVDTQRTNHIKRVRVAVKAITENKEGAIPDLGLIRLLIKESKVVITTEKETGDMCGRLIKNLNYNVY